MTSRSKRPDANALKEQPGDHDGEARGFARWSPVVIRRTSEGIQIRIRWRRLLLTTVAVTFVGWLALSFAALLYTWHVHQAREVTYLQLALPWRWDEYRRLRADRYAAEAKRLLSSAHWRAAYLHLHAALRKNPAHAEARRLLAQFETMRRRYDLAEKTLLEGLAFHRNDPAYLRVVFQFLLQYQYDERALTLAADILADGTADPLAKRTAAFYAATTQAYRGSYDRAEDLIFDHGLLNTREGRLLDARIQWERGYPDLAFVKLEQLRAELPHDDEVAALLADYRLAHNQPAEARRLTLLRQLARPDAAAPRIALLKLYSTPADTPRLQREIDDLFRDFGDDADDLLALADFASERGDASLARRIYDHTRSHDLPWEGPALLTVEAAIAAGQYQQALDLARTLLSENPDWARRYYALFNGLQAIALYGLGDRDAAQLYLKNFLGSPHLRSGQLTATSRRLAAVGATAEAREVLARAVQDDPLNQAALSTLIELNLEAGHIDALPDAVRRLLKMRKPSPELLARVHRELGRDRWLFLADRTTTLEALEAR